MRKHDEGQVYIFEGDVWEAMHCLPDITLKDVDFLA